MFYNTKKMYQHIYVMLFALVGIIANNLATAAVSPASKTFTIDVNQNFTLGRDSANIVLVSPESMADNETRLQWSRRVFARCAYEYFEPAGTPAGTDSQGRTIYEVFANNPLPNGAKNIGYVIDIKDKPAGTYYPVTGARTVFFPFPGRRPCPRFADYNIKVGLMKPRNVASNESLVYPSNMLLYLGDVVIRDRGGFFNNNYTFNETEFGRHQVYLQVNNIGLQVKTCELSSSSNQTIDLGSITKQTLEASTAPVSGVGTGNNQANFVLNCAAGDGISVYATISDANSPMTQGTSLSTNLNGVGVSLTRETNLTSGFVPVQLGPQSTIQGNPNQFQLSNSGTTSPFIRIRGQYVKTGQTVDVGSVNAQALITFSYQ